MGGQGGKVLRIGLSTPVAWLDPRQASDASSHMVLAQVFEAPYAQAGPEADPEPRVMASLLEREERGAGAIYSAPVRPGLLFSDGTPVGPDHVVESLRRVGPLREVSLSTRGDRVLFTLERPIAGFEFQLSKRWCMVALERGGRYYGTGPFMVESVGPDPQGMIRLVRNPHHRHPVALDAIEFRVYPPAPDGRHDALLAAVESGEVHFTAALPRDEVGRLG